MYITVRRHEITDPKSLRYGLKKTKKNIGFYEGSIVKKQTNRSPNTAEPIEVGEILEIQAINGRLLYFKGMDRDIGHISDDFIPVELVVTHHLGDVDKATPLKPSDYGLINLKRIPYQVDARQIHVLKDVTDITCDLCFKDSPDILVATTVDRNDNKFYLQEEVSDEIISTSLGLLSDEYMPYRSETNKKWYAVITETTILAAIIEKAKYNGQTSIDISDLESIIKNR